MVTPPESVRRHFLPWDRPLLPQAVAWLAGGWHGDGPLDLADTLVVVPTRQAGRRLREALAEFAAGRGQAVFPPRVITPEQAFDLARAEGTKVAPRAAELLAWTEVLRGLELTEVRALFPVDPPQRTLAWALALAEEFARLQDALAENGLRFADVPARAGGDFGEAQRWRELAELERRQAAALAARGLVAPGAAQIAAAAKPGQPPAGGRRVVLVAVTDPRPLALAIFAAWSETIEVSVLAFGAEEDAERFDGWGRPLAAAWSEAPLAWRDFEQRVHVGVDADAQAAGVARWAGAYAEREGVLAVGCADAEVVPRLAAALTAAGRAPFLPQGKPWRRHALAALIEALRAAAREDAWEPVAALARDAAVLAWLGRAVRDFSAARLLAGIDALQERHLPPTLAEAQRQAAGAEFGKRFPETAAALREIDRLLAGWRGGPFPDAWRGALAGIFAGRTLDTAQAEDRALAEAAEAWRGAVEAVAVAMPRGMPADEAGELALRLFGAANYFEDKPAGAVEIDGWLELVFRSEPHLVVAGVNDGALPEAVTGDAFLPESLREQLGLKTNAQRLARDAWQLAALAASRAAGGRLDLFLGKTSAAGDPLRPSRLLFLCDDRELPRRVEFLFRELPPPGGNVAWQRAWTLRVPRGEPLQKLRVTAFRDYLRCPLRFYLKHALKMEAVETDKRELAAVDFGELVHRVLERLGRDDDWRDGTDERGLADAFGRELDRQVAERFGRELSLPLIVQVESARQRLAHAARVQAAARAEGWRIEHVEWKFPEERLALGGLPVIGRIDRIERHEASGRWRVLDYKTAESAVAPAEAHLRNARAGGEEILPEARVAGGKRERVWTDLQLPLYRWAVREALGAGEVTVGYFNLPKAVGETAIATWEEFDDELERSALACAEAVARAVAAGRFGPPAEEVKHDEFAALFHEGVAESVEWEAAR